MECQFFCGSHVWAVILFFSQPQINEHSLKKTFNPLASRSNPQHDEWYHSLHSFDLVDFQPNMLCGWIAGEEARTMEQVPDELVLDVCHELLVKFTGNRDIPKPLRLIR